MLTHLLHFQREFNKNLLQLFIDKVNGKLFKLIVLKQRERALRVLVRVRQTFQHEFWKESLKDSGGRSKVTSSCQRRPLYFRCFTTELEKTYSSLTLYT